MLQDIMLDQFQYAVLELLVRNKSILDLLSKSQDSNARINRSIIKAVTHCGCISIDAKKQNYNEDFEFEETPKLLDTHLEGNLCNSCRDIIEKEIGSNLFYLASIANTLDLNLYDILLKENERLKVLGKFSLR
jgi:hypothetical protein